MYDEYGIYVKVGCRVVSTTAPQPGDQPDILGKIHEGTVVAHEDGKVVIMYDEGAGTIAVPPESCVVQISDENLVPAKPGDEGQFVYGDLEGGYVYEGKVVQDDMLGRLAVINEYGGIACLIHPGNLMHLVY